MLTSSTHGVKAALLRSNNYTRVAEQPTNGGAGTHGLLLYYSTLLPSTDPTRAITKLHTYLIEGDLRQLWRQAKQRFRDARSVYKQHPQQEQLQQHAGGSTAAGSASVATRATAAELEHLYGTNGVFRVSSSSVVG